MATPMGPTLAEQVRAAGDAGFSARMTAALVRVALEVLTEPAEVHGNPLRRSLASGVLTQPDGYVYRFALAVLADRAAYESQVTEANGEDPPSVRDDGDADDALLDRTRDVWSLLAGVPPRTPG